MKSKIEYGDDDAGLPDVIDRKDVVTTISLRIEGDLLDALKAAAEKEPNVGYQTLMKEILRSHLGLESRVTLKRPFSESMRLSDFPELEKQIRAIVASEVKKNQKAG